MVTCLLLAASAAAAQRPVLSPAVRTYVAADTPVVAITNVRVIDGSGAPARERQTVVIREGKIISVSATADDGRVSALMPPPVVIDGTGKTVIPGFVMVHEHMFYPPSAVTSTPTYVELAYTSPKLYLGAGVTTARTGGSMSPYADLSLRAWIDSGTIPGPALDVTGPYLTGPGLALAQFRVLKDSADARRMVRHWAEEGATSFKAYMHITRDELRAAVEEAHRLGLKVTGHLCSVTYREAADIGIDDLEHGFMVASDFVAGKQPDRCPQGVTPSIAALDPNGAAAAALIKRLVERGVAVTSTLAIFESFVPGRPPTPQRVLEAMSVEARARFLQARAATAGNMSSPWLKAFANDMALEKKFVDAGGLLVVGTDPTGSGGVLAGYGSQRAVELLVEAGFTPVEAIRIATLNGATYLNRAARIGTIAAGKQADLLLIAGDPGARITDIEKIELVFKDGVAYDSAKLLASARGLVGIQ